MSFEESATEISDVSVKQDAALWTCINTLKQSLPSHNTHYDREKLKDAAHRLTLALETPGDTAQRVAFIVFQIVAINIANRLNLFQTIVDSPAPMSSKQLAQTVGGDPSFIVRLLRYLVATGVIGERDVDRFQATNITRNLMVPGVQAGVNFHSHSISYAALALPDFLDRTNYQNPTNSKDCAFQDGNRTKDNIYEWFGKNPDHLDLFNQWMAGQREGRANWLEFFPLNAILLDGFKSNAGKEDAAIFVDVGGANGHEIGEVKKRYPDLPGKFILQDRPESIKQALPIAGMQAMAHDMFTEQPITGAKCYYLRNVPINWSDAKCHIIFTNLAAAMERGYSKLLINENVVPNKGANLQTVSRDMLMMAVLGAMERTEQHWRELLAKAGLKVEEIWTHEKAESVIVAVKE